MEDEREVGKVTHFFTRASVAAIMLTAPVAVGDTLVFRGATTDFEQAIGSMQIDRQNIEQAEAGKEIGVKVQDRVRQGDTVYKK